jgi:hypothetical protein
MEYKVEHDGDYDYYSNAHNACKAYDAVQGSDRSSELYLCLSGWSTAEVKELEAWINAKYPTEYGMPEPLVCMGNIIEVSAKLFDESLTGRLQVELVRHPTAEEVINGNRYGCTPQEVVDHLVHLRCWVLRRLDGGGTTIAHDSELAWYRRFA